MDARARWRSTGKNTMLAEIMQTGDEMAAEIEQLRARVAELEAELQLAWNTCGEAETERNRYQATIATQAEQIESLENKLALDIHSCHPDCSNSMCVNRRLREQIKVAREALESIQNDSKDTCLSSVRHFGRIASKAIAKLWDQT